MAQSHSQFRKYWNLWMSHETNEIQPLSLLSLSLSLQAFGFTKGRVCFRVNLALHCIFLRVGVIYIFATTIIQFQPNSWNRPPNYRVWRDLFRFENKPQIIKCIYNLPNEVYAVKLAPEEATFVGLNNGITQDIHSRQSSIFVYGTCIDY